MSQHEISERSSMEEAFETQNLPATRPAGPQQVIIENRPQGAQVVAVHRTKATVLREIKALASAAGDGWFYRWPVKSKDGSKDWVEGPSVKCTNAIAREYGNCFVMTQAIDQGTHWMITARFVDMETGFALERPFQQRKNQNVGGGMDKDRALDIVFQIGVSKATRNVVANALAEFVDYGFEEAKSAIVGRVGKDLEKYRARVAQRLIELKVPADRVEAQIGKTIDKWLAPDVARVIAEIQSCQDGMADPDEMWPPKEFGAARPNENQVPDRQIAENNSQQQKVEPPKEAEKQKAEAAAGEPPAEEDAVTKQVTLAIHKAATGNKALLDELDGIVTDLCDREHREDQNARWGQAYVMRKNEIRSKHTGPSGLLEMLPKAAEAVSATEADLDAWIADMKKEADGMKSEDDLDVHQDKVGKELTGDQARLDDWANYCNALARKLRRRR